MTDHIDFDTSSEAPVLDPRVERSRASVVEAAAELLLHEGPDAITHARVADAAGVSRTTVYKHYPDRSDLLRATVEAIGEHLPDTDSTTGDLRTDLIALLEHLATDFRDPGRTRLIAMMMERALHDEAVAGVRNSFLAELREAFASVIASGVACGELAAETDIDIGLSSLAGSLLFNRLLAATAVDDQHVAALVDHFIRTNAPH